MIKVNQDELQEQIGKLKQSVADKTAKAGGKTSDREVREARKKVKRAQRKLRAARAYKTAGKKGEDKSAGTASA